MNQITDTDRLNFLFKYFSIENIGGSKFVPGIVIDYEKLEQKLTLDNENIFNNNDFRKIIDQVINK